ncbi:MAG: hypothetical protein CFE29_00380 [Bradyrhizobiaceae bacterium PARB1]|jgi:hypothetical protein|nr:MAG: hypothetical protein CFE29_00380 [Bradyrhizobiaceae bacterium PARB1]
MRTLWPIEQEILAIAAAAYPASAETIRQQISTAYVVSYENSGSGFFSDLTVAATTPLLEEKSYLDAAYGNVAGVNEGMGFIVFLKDGRLSMIEGYCNGDDSTAGIDFSRVVFELKSWG